MPAGWVGVGIAAVGALSSLFGGNKAAHAAKRQAREEARLEGIITVEKLRKLRLEEEIVKGQTEAAGAASGVDIRMGSVAQIIAEQGLEFTRERIVTSRVGASRAANIRSQGAAIGSQARYQGIANFFNFAGQAAGAWPGKG